MQLAGSTMGSGISEFLSDREKMTSAVGTTVGIAFGIYAARVSYETGARALRKAVLRAPDLYSLDSAS